MAKPDFVEDHLDTKRYVLGDRDQSIVAATVCLLRRIARSPLPRRDQETSISQLLHVLENLPEVTEDIDASIQLTGPGRHFGEHEIYHSWEIAVESEVIQITAAGYFYRASTGGDSFTSMQWSAAPGYEPELNEYLEGLAIVDDAQPYESEVTCIDLSESGYSLDAFLNGEEIAADDDEGEQSSASRSGSDCSTDLTEHANLLTALIAAGAKEIADFIANKERDLSFATWASAVSNRLRQDDLRALQSDLQWAWDSLRHDRRIIDQCGQLPPAGVRWKSSDKKFHVLNAAEIFVVALKLSHVANLRQSPKANPRDEAITVTLKQPLSMKPGKADRLQCCDAKAELVVEVSEVFSQEREADVMRIDADRVAVGDGVVTVQVDSLNQAYTVASRRLEPERRSHGGRTYDHFLLARGRNRILMEDLRQRVESDDWHEPHLSNTKTARA